MQSLDRMESMDAINRQNRKRRNDGVDNPMLTGRDPSGMLRSGQSEVDYLHFGRDMGLPWLPYAFTRTCAFCGITGVVLDRKQMMPLQFLETFLDKACCKTPFVYNVLYQMCSDVAMEMEEAIKWQMVHENIIPDWSRCRIIVCSSCMTQVSRHSFPSPNLFAPLG